VTPEVGHEMGAKVRQPALFDSAAKYVRATACTITHSRGPGMCVHWKPHLLMFLTLMPVQLSEFTTGQYKDLWKVRHMQTAGPPPANFMAPLPCSQTSEHSHLNLPL